MFMGVRTMRFPSIERNYWQLRSGEESHQAHPDTFWMPPSKERNNLRVGQAAKLIFDIEGEEDGSVEVQGERMWVIVSEVNGGWYMGILDARPQLIETGDHVYLCFGAEIPFRAEHVIDPADPPADYVEWQLSQEPERRWPRD
jgi:hypothetical protein